MKHEDITTWKVGNLKNHYIWDIWQVKHNSLISCLKHRATINNIQPCFNCLAGIGWATDVGTVDITGHTSKLETSTNDSTETLAGNQTSSNGETISLPRNWSPLAPGPGENSTKSGGNRVDGSWDDETKCNSTPVWQPLLVLLARSLKVDVTHDGLDHGDGTKDDGEDTRVEWDTDIWISDGTGNGGPGSNGWSGERALAWEVLVDDAWVGGGEEDELEEKAVSMGSINKEEKMLGYLRCQGRARRR